MSRSVTLGVILVLLAAVSPPAVMAQSPEPIESSSPEPVTLRMQDARFAHSASVLADGTVLVVGGSDGFGSISGPELFDPASRQFRSVGDVQQPRLGHRATPLADGRVLITGGMTPRARALSSVEVYDPETETFSRVGRLAEPRFAHTATLLDDGLVLITGGYGKKAPRSKSSAELFDPAAGKSTEIGKMTEARARHIATKLEDGRIVIIGGSRRGGRPSRAVEVYDPQRQRFRSRAELSAFPNLHEAPRLADGRVFITAANGGAMLIAPDAKSSVQLEGPPYIGGQVSATLLDDGRVVVIGSRDSEPARVILFDPATDSLEAADPMRQVRQDHAASRLHDGTVLVVGGIVIEPGCYQALATAEIWDPGEMASVAGDENVECLPWEDPPPQPLPPLGAETSGGRVEMPGSAFAITVPDDWSVEIADPDTDVFKAKPGTAWEALRATDPDDAKACSVAVGVATVRLAKRHGTASGGSDVVPAWHPKKRGILQVPSPPVTERDTTFASSAPRVRRKRDHPGLGHDALYSIHCVGDSERDLAAITESFEFLPRAE